MRPSILLETLTSLNKTLTPVNIEGPPGGGKTSLGKALSYSLKVPCIVKHMPTMMLEDFGIPDVMNKTSADMGFDYILPGWFPKQGKSGTENGGVLLFDDRAQANNDLQKVLANIILERELNGHKLADGWHIISTGNRQSDRAGANRTLSQLADREVTLEYEVNTDDWDEWAANNGVSPLVRSFIRWRPALLHDFDPNRDKNATPRGWERLSRIWDNIPTAARLEVAKGTIGAGAAEDFTGFVRIYEKLPSLDRVIAQPDTTEVPEDTATCYAISGAIAERATVDNFDRIMRYARRMKPEFTSITVQFATRRDRELARTEAFTKWAIDYKEVLI